MHWKNCIQKQEGKTANDIRSLINVISSWKFILAIVIWHDILFQGNKTSKLAVFHVMNSEIYATQSFLQDYPQNGNNTAVVSAREIAKDVGVKSAFVEKRKRNRNRMFDYESEDQSSELTQESQFKVIVFFASCRSCHCFTERLI